MIILYNRSRIAIIRIIDDWIIEYSKPIHLGWLDKNVVYNRTGQGIGWFLDGILRESNGKIIAKDKGLSKLTMAPIPSKQKKPTLGKMSGFPRLSFFWSDLEFTQFFDV